MNDTCYDMNELFCTNPYADADVSLQSAANGILLRSQHYLEQQFSQHRNRLHQLDDIRSATPTDLALNSSRSRSFLT
jgi:hypothetical protein